MSDRGWARVRVADDLTVTTYDDEWCRGEAHYLFHEVFTHDDYLTGLAPLRPDAVVIDAGANIGLFGLLIARACPRARLLAVEPVPGTCALLRRNLADAGPVDAMVRQVALGAVRGTAELTVYRHLPANSTAFPHQKPAAWTAAARAQESDPVRAAAKLATERVEVASARLSDLLPQRVPTGASVDLLKIDVEGAELDVLRGIDDADWPRIRAVVAEVHDVDGRLGAVLGLLRSWGFDVAARTPAMMPTGLHHHLVVAQRDPTMCTGEA